MAIYLYLDKPSTLPQEESTTTLLKTLGYTILSDKVSYINHGTIITLSLSRGFIQLNFHDEEKYQKEFQVIIDQLRRIFPISSYQTDLEAPIPEGLSLEGLVRK